MKDLTPILKKILDSLLFKGKVNFNIETSFETDVVNNHYYFYNITVDLDVDKMILISPEHDKSYLEIVDDYDFFDRLDDVFKYLGTNIEFNLFFNHINYKKTNEKLTQIQSKINSRYPKFKMNMVFDKNNISPILNVKINTPPEKSVIGLKNEEKEMFYNILTNDTNNNGFNIIDMIINLKN